MKQPVLKTASEVIDAMGGTTAASRVFEVSPAAVSMWRGTGFPARLRLRVVRECEKRSIRFDPALVGEKAA